MNDVATTSGFADELAQHAQGIYADAAPTIERLAGLAGSLRMDTARRNIEASLEGLRRPTFTIIVFGRFNTGKSTFLNVLLGRLERQLADLPGRHGAPLPMDDMPVNARVTTISYGEEPSVTVIRDGGKREVRSLKWFLDNSPLRATKQQNIEAFGDIEQFELTYPFENGKAGIVLIDTPGTDDAPDRTVFALQALNKADAAILLFNTTGLAGQGELEFAQQMIDLGLTNYFTVINRYNGRTVDDKLQHYAWDRLVGELKGGPAYEGQAFSEHKIYFVDALAALEGRLAGDDQRVESSGIEPFEQALARFYETERRKVHVQRWIDQALGQAAAIDSFVGQQIPALTVEREDFQRRFEEAQPRIRELRTRKVQPARIFKRFRERAVEALLLSFQELMYDVAEALPIEIEATRLKSLESITDKVASSFIGKTKQAALKEAAELVNGYVRERQRAWETAEPPASGALTILQPLWADAMEELRDEIAQTEREFRDLRFSLAEPLTAAAELGTDAPAEWWARIAPAAAGLVFGAPDLIASGAVNGWKGFEKAMLVHLGVVAVFGVLTLPATLPVLAVGWLSSLLARSLWQGHDLERDAKQAAIQEFANGLRVRIEAVRPALEASLQPLTRELETEMTAGYSGQIEQQISSLTNMERVNGLSRDKREETLDTYGKVRTELARHVEKLTYVRSFAGI